MTEAEQPARAWLERARDDLWAAGTAAEAEPAHPWLAVYHAQQAAEKALKALVVHETGAPAVPTHDLSVLLDRLRAAGTALPDLEPAASVLTPYAVEPRYPGGVEYGEDEATRAVGLAREVVERVEGRMG